MKTVMKFVMLSIVIGLFATASVADTVTETKNIDVSCTKTAPKTTGLIRYKGDTNQWVFKLNLVDGAHLVGTTSWHYPTIDQNGSSWGLWAFDKDDTDHMALNWSSPDTTGKFTVTVSGSVSCGNGGGGGDAIPFTAGWEGVIPTITGITSNHGATRTNMLQDYPNAGDQNWGCVKAVGSHVKVKVTTGPNDEKAEWDEIVWNGGEKVPDGNGGYESNNYRWYSRDDATKFEVTPTIDGKGLKPLYIWVIWGTYTIRIDGTTDAAQICEDQAYPVIDGGFWLDFLGGGYTLGPIDHCHNPLLSLCYAVGRTQGIAKLDPSGIGNVVEHGAWKMIRKATTKLFKNGLPYNGKTTPDRVDVTDISDPQALDLDPSGVLNGQGTDKLYDADTPGSNATDFQNGPAATIDHTSEVYDNFSAWAIITLDAPFECTNKVEYSYQVRVDLDSADGNCAEIDLNKLLRSYVVIPTSAYYQHR